MSKRIFQTLTADRADSEKAPEPGTPVLVEGGWDRPMKWLYLQVERLDRIGGQPVETLFSNLPRGGMSVGEIQDALLDLVGHWPSAWIDEIKEDNASRPGNEISRHGVFDPIGLEERLSARIEENEELAVAIKTLHRDGHLRGSKRSLRTMHRLGLLSYPSRLMEAFVVAKKVVVERSTPEADAFSENGSRDSSEKRRSKESKKEGPTPLTDKG
jgi:hypothetical protein